MSYELILDYPIFYRVFINRQLGRYNDWRVSNVMYCDVSAVPRLRHPLRGPIIVNAQSDVVLECDLIQHDAFSSPTVMWFKNAEAVVTSDYFLVQESGQRLRILGVLASDAGLYQCIVSNEAGTVHSATMLTVRQPGSLVVVIIVVADDHAWLFTFKGQRSRSLKIEESQRVS